MNYFTTTNIFQWLVVASSLCACHSFSKANNMRGVDPLELNDASLTVEVMHPLQAQANANGLTLRQFMRQAIENDDGDLVMQLATLGIDISKMIDEDCGDAFAFANIKGSRNAAAALSNYLKDLYNNNNTKLVYSSTNGVRFLMLFSEIGDTDTVRTILDAYPDKINQTDKQRSTALHYAVEAGKRSAACVDLLVARGANPNQRNAYSDSPISMAFEQNHYELANRMNARYQKKELCKRVVFI